MKQLFTLVLLFPSLVAYSQIEIKKEKPMNTIGEVKMGSYFVATLSYEFTDTLSDTTYILLYWDLQYKNLTEIEGFSHTGKILDLYNLFYNQFDQKDRTRLVTKVGYTDIKIITGTQAIYIFKGDSYFALTKGQLQKLFKMQ